MVQPFRFAIVSDPHVTLPHTLREHPQRFHLVEFSVPVLEQILDRLASEALDFLLMPGDLTQHGERENHAWLAQRLQALPFPTYVVPGNHDVLTRDGCDRTLSLAEFPQMYRFLGYDSDRPYYCQEILPGLVLLGLNSIAFDETGKQLFTGWLDDEQLAWISEQLPQLAGKWVMVMIHHNVLEHLPGQEHHPLGKRYILKNRTALLDLLQSAQVRLVLTGHLHVQDIAQLGNLWEITTGSLVSYPHPYRILTAQPQADGHLHLTVESFREQSVPTCSDLQAFSHQWMCDRAIPFMVKLLMCPPLSLPEEKAQQIAPELRDFWANIAAGDQYFDYAHLPETINQHLKQFGAIDAEGIYQPIDNHTTLILKPGQAG